MDKPTCSVDGCDKSAYVRGWCTTHYDRWKRNGDPLATKRRPPGSPVVPCSVDGCDRPQDALGWCGPHWQRHRQHGDVQADKPIRQRWINAPGAICSVEGCEDPPKARGWCARHYARWQKTGDVRADVPIAAVVIVNAGQCAVDDCETGAFHKGWCMTHYSRWRRTGTTDPPTEVTEDVLARRREARRAYHRKYKAAEYRRDPERLSARVRAWRASNPDRAALFDAAKLRRRRGAPKIKFTADELAAKIAYWGHKCWLCGAPYQSIDHVKPLMAGGWHMLANLRPACLRCNSSKGYKWPFDTARRSHAA